MKEKEQSDLRFPSRRDEGREPFLYREYSRYPSDPIKRFPILAFPGVVIVLLVVAALLLFAWCDAPVI